MQKIHLWLLVAIFLLGLGLRLFRLGDAPAAAIIDEAHFGYIAYSLLETGRDEHGVSWPLLFVGFGDQKLPAYAYSLLPVVSSFGLSVMSIRLPSALFGSLSILLMYLLARSLGWPRKVGLLSALILAISPWPFFLSRFGFESNLALFFFILGLWLVNQGLRQAAAKTAPRWFTRQNLWLVGGAVALGITWYSYIAYRPVSLAIGLLMVGYAWWRQQISWVSLILFSVIMLSVVSPLLMPGVSGANTARFEQIGIVNDPGIVMVVHEQRNFCSAALPSVICYGLWNKPVIIIATLFMRYWQIFSPQFMAFVGESTDTYLTVGGFGQFYAVLYLFFLIGVGALLVTASRKPAAPSNTTWLMILGFLISPVPSILAGEAQKVRLSPLLPFVVLAIAYGLALSHNWLTAQVPKFVGWLVIAGLSLSLLFAVTNFMVNFHTIHAVKNDIMYQSFAPSIWEYVDQNPEAQVYIKPFFSDPLMSYAFYTSFDPQTYQNQVVLGEKEASGFQHAVKLGRIDVGEKNIMAIGCQALAEDKVALYVTNQAEPQGYVAKTLLSTNGVMTYGYIYDAKMSALLNLEHCDQLSEQQKQVLLRDYQNNIKEE